MSLDIQPLKTSKSGITQRKLMDEDIVMKHPTISIFSGSAGSGKTTVIANLLTNPLMYGKSYELMQNKKGEPKPYFDAVFLMIGSDDDGYDHLIKEGAIMPNHVSKNPTADNIQHVIDSQKVLLEKAGGDISKIPKILFILDDVISDGKLMRSKPMLELFTAGRHINSSTFIGVQHINLIPLAVRNQASYILSFKGNRREIETIANQFCPPLSTIANFMKLLFLVTQNTDECKHNFLVISKKAPLEKRFRRNFTDYIMPELTKKYERQKTVKSKKSYIEQDLEDRIKELKQEEMHKLALMVKHREEREEEEEKEKEDFRPSLEEIHVPEVKPKKRMTGLDLIMKKKGTRK